MPRATGKNRRHGGQALKDKPAASEAAGQTIGPHLKPMRRGRKGISRHPGIAARGREEVGPGAHNRVEVGAVRERPALEIGREIQ